MLWQALFYRHRWARGNEGANGAIGILESGTSTANGIGYRNDGFMLTDDARVQIVFHFEQLFLLGLLEFCYGNTCPVRYNKSDIIFGDFLSEHASILLYFREFCGLFFQLGFKVGDRTIEKL